MSINVDTAGSHNNFEKAQIRLLDYKSLIDEGKRNQRNVSSVEGRGSGSGGRGRGRGGPGRGQVQGDGLSLRRADTTNRSKHVNTADGHALTIAKLPNGDWDTVQISRGTRNHLAKMQVHINKKWYPSSSYGEMEPLERRMIFINQSVEKGHGKGGSRPVSSVAAVSVADSQMSAITATLSGMSKNITGLLNASEKHQRKFERIRVKQREENLFSSIRSLSSDDDIRSNQGKQALARSSL